MEAMVELSEALEILWAEADRTSQLAVSEAIGVYSSSITRWKAGARPTGKSKELLLKWAQSRPTRSPRQSAPAPSMASEARALLDPVAQLVAEGQAEQAAWVLEFAARLLEAGAKRLRQGANREQILSAVEGREAEITRPRKARPRASEA